MRLAYRILIGIGCVAAMSISWFIVVNSKPTAEKQLELITQAAALMDDCIYIRAVPLLEEAAGYNAAHTAEAEEALKKAYLALLDTRGFNRKYTSLLKKQMDRKDADPSLFAEAAEYYLRASKITEALEVLRTGIGKTGSELLTALYEQNRYAYETNRTNYDYIADIYGTTVQVQREGLWGLAASDGVLLIPCEYEKISTYSADRAIVKKDGEIYAVNINNNRVAKLNDTSEDFGNYADDRISLLKDGNWRRATGEFVIGTILFEQLGMNSGGYAAAKTGGRWGVINLANNWLIPAEYDGIIQDELGRCYARDAVFAKKDGKAYLFVGGRQVGEAFEDARPFSDEGYAAVKRDGKWGFIDIDGIVVIDFRFDDALSFGQHMAAVKQDGLWGYINMKGDVVIEPVYMEAKSFSNGSAPVLTERGWQFITLLEYKRRASL